MAEENRAESNDAPIEAPAASENTNNAQQEVQQSRDSGSAGSGANDYRQIQQNTAELQNSGKDADPAQLTADLQAAVNFSMRYANSNWKNEKPDGTGQPGNVYLFDASSRATDYLGKQSSATDKGNGRVDGAGLLPTASNNGERSAKIDGAEFDKRLIGKIPADRDSAFSQNTGDPDKDRIRDAFRCQENTKKLLSLLGIR